MNLIEKLNWRYATKSMNGDTIPQEKMNRILEAIRLAPSSFGLTPYKVIVVQSSEIREDLKIACWGQQQIVDASAVLVFAAKTNIDENLVDEFIVEVANSRGMDVESLDQYRYAVNLNVTQMTQEQRVEWAKKQAYIGLGFGLVAAATENVDSTPMEGFMADQVDLVLNLSAENMTSACILTLGYRDETKDYLANVPKFRFEKEKFFKFI
jgi:nitroreductase